MSKQLLTLAITETRPLTSEFNIVALEIASQKIVELKLNRNEIVTSSGSISWDISYITNVQEITLISNKSLNKVYKVDGTELLKKDIKLLQLVLESKSMSGLEFFASNISSSVIKVKKVLSLYFQSTDVGFKSYIKVEIFGKSEPLIILNKDYRWIKFWKWISENDNLEEKKAYYLELLNNNSKVLFLVLCRYYFTDHTHYWIAGMHWLSKEKEEQYG